MSGVAMAMTPAAGPAPPGPPAPTAPPPSSSPAPPEGAPASQAPGGPKPGGPPGPNGPAAGGPPATNGPPGPGGAARPPANSATIQKMLDENSSLIKTISEYQVGGAGYWWEVWITLVSNWWDSSFLSGQSSVKTPQSPLLLIFLLSPLHSS